MVLERSDREELERHVKNIHAKLVKEKSNCAERTFLTIRSIMETDIPSEAVALLTGLGGGIGGTHSSVCGAVTGGVAALGLVYGRRNPSNESNKEAYRTAREFYCRFKSRFGTEVCRDLIRDLLRANKFDSEERKERCHQYTSYAIELCIEIINSQID